MRQSDEFFWSFAERWTDRDVVGIHDHGSEVICGRCGNMEIGVVFVLENFPHGNELRCAHCLCHIRWLRKEANKDKRQGLRPSVRFRIIQRDGGRCYYCRRERSQLDPGEFLHVDHIVPVSAGGTDDDANLVCACSTCNLGKGKEQ